jgi:flagellar export protein FliJ
MERFRFRLEQLLKLRENQLEIEETRLKQIIGRIEQILKEIANTRAEQRASEQEFLFDKQAQGSSLLALSTFISLCAERVRCLSRLAESCHRERDAQAGRVRDLMRKKMLLEKLRERQLAEYLLESDRQSQREASEFHLARWTKESVRAARRQQTN